MNEATIGSCALQALKSYYRKWVKQEEGVRADQDPEALHQMRVGLRRLRSGLLCFAPILPRSIRRQEPKLGQISRILGRVRDLDVLRQALTNNYMPLLPEVEQVQLQKYLAQRERQRQKYFHRMIALLDSPFYRRTRKTIGSWLKDPHMQEAGDFAVTEMMPQLLLPSLRAVLLPNWNLRKQKQLHDLRKLFKLTRYQLECFTPYFGEELNPSLRHLATAQEVLGSLHDRLVLLETFSQKQWRRLPHLYQIIQQHQGEDWRTWYSLNYNLQWLQVLLQIRSLCTAKESIPSSQEN
ncbi:MAG: CHAD domain-containing protein [Pseudanabaenaceae cyanobacterium SKYGB_i_bin29]|nr:CHAD domain-containing protein [Pseudanabaenaceae cyanobacterium SKYG29]MDW8421552.1 CHAD domain-containing protein [Pseudanabaenaceae cyanobacterium SKYGB_i_bin29]